MKVSIVMPTYNVSNYVYETFESVLNQSYQNWELIIVDDCSTDGTQDVLRMISASEPRVKVFFLSENGGAGNCRNKALAHVSGRFISFLDSDDLWRSNKLELQIAHMLDLNAPISHTSFVFIGLDGESINGSVNVSSEVDLISNLKNTEIGTSTSMIDTSMILYPIKFDIIRARQDLKLWIQLLGKGYKSYGLNLPLVKYRVRPNSVSSNKLKMLYITFKVYLNIDELPLSTKLVCFFYYVLNAIKKRT